MDRLITADSIRAPRLPPSLRAMVHDGAAANSPVADRENDRPCQKKGSKHRLMPVKAKRPTLDLHDVRFGS
jgi:hypothetical protein